MTTPKANRTLDCRNQMYPVPILKAEQALAEMSAGQTLEVLATDANTKPDLAKWAERANGELIEVVDEADGQFRFYVRKSGAAAAHHKEAEKKDENLFLVVLRTGINQPGQVRAAFMYASLAAAMGQDTVVYCVQEGADAAKKDVVQKDSSPSGGPTISQRIAEALDMGVRVEVCEQTASVRNIKAEDLIPEATLIGGAALIDYAIRARGTLTF
ncbi:MAG TPA: sulfurtransferase TusA family protein [Anaerolineales bacterium]|nr:sulfurtransferase TusA family protein [Anaerolineales bacterium]